MSQPELHPLSKAAEGLLYPSETDAPFEPFLWPAARGSTAREQVAAHAPKGQPIAEVAVPRFFAELDAAPDADRFRSLRQTLESNLTDLHVFRVGQLRIDVYLIGRLPSGDFAGLHTISVET